METVWGVKWPIPSGSDISILIIIIVLIILFFILLRYYFDVKARKSQEYQLYLFKTKRLGLSNYNIKILNGIVNSLSLKSHISILKDPSLFESSIHKFHAFLKTQNETLESQSSIYKEIVIIYEKLYHPISSRKQIEKIQDIDDNQLLSFTIDIGYVYIGRVTGIDNNMTIEVFEDPNDLQKLMEDMPVNIFFWRSGDAEYNFKSIINLIEKNIISITIPEEFERGKEVRTPDVDVNIQCSVIIAEEPAFPEQKEEKEPINDDSQLSVAEEIDFEQKKGIIFRLNIDEATIRLTDHIDHDKNIFLEFEIKEFVIKTKCTILIERTVKDKNVYYYIFKFEELTEVARGILHKYILER